MSTFAEQDAALAAEIRRILADHGFVDVDGLVDLLLEDLTGLMSTYAARQVERHARPDRRWVPKKQRERKAG